MEATPRECTRFVFPTLTNNVVTAKEDPARVTNLTMSTINKTSSPFPMYSRVELVCTWEKGNPSQQVRLVDRHSKQLVPVTRAGSEIRYTFPGVRCPPEFDESPRREFSVPPNTTTDIKIPVRTHSKTIKECTLTKIITPENETPKQTSGAGVGDSSQVTKDCKRYHDYDTDAAEVTGEGETTSSKAFVTSSSPLREANDATSLDWRIAGPIGAAVFIFVVAVVVSVTMITRRRGTIVFFGHGLSTKLCVAVCPQVGTVTTRRHRAPPKDRELPEVPAAAMLPVPSGIDKRLSSASHQYMEVEDAICPTKTS
ncbi:hypothetical protein BaRGS_00037683 [Batillaria attramentaria]|uniref:Uncharacterized protein n=1 Tax=Batillaria attramentaria TaxID=370345 RepID=A0ABD0J7Z0_9CAEN